MSGLSIQRRGRVAIVTLDRGDGRNALSLALMAELTACAHAFARDAEISAIVLAAQGPFCAGADLKDPDLAARAGMTLAEQRVALKAGPDLCEAWERLEQVTICAIEGFCIGGGLALAVACDFRILGRRAHVRLPEIPLGMNMSWRAQPRLVALIGPSRTKRLVIFGEKLDADTAERWGLADAVCDDGAALATALDWAGRIAALPPVPVRMAKTAITACAQANAYATSFMDLDQFALTARTRDQAEAVAAFVQKRAAAFTGD